MFKSTAHVYDLVYEFAGKDYGAESAVLADQIRSRLPNARTLLDVACGSGGHLLHLREMFEVTGLDLDARMLAEARTRLPGVQLVEADMRSFELDRHFDAVVCLFSSIGYLPDRAALNAAIARMAFHVSPGGVLVVDGWVRPESWIGSGSVHVVSGKNDDVALARVGRSERRGDKTLLEFHHLVATLDGIDHLVDHHELTLFSDDDYLGALRKADLTASIIDGPFSDRGRFIGWKPS